MAGEFADDEAIMAEVERYVQAALRYGALFHMGFSLLPDFANFGQTVPDPDEIRGPLTDSCRRLMVNDPAPWYAVASSLERCVRPIDESRPQSGDFYEGYKAAEFQLGTWRGIAADAYREHIGKMERFAKVQSTGMIDTGALALAAFEVLRQAREDTLTLLRMGADGLRAMASSKSSQEIAAHLVLGAALVGGLANLSAGPTASTAATGVRLNDALKAGAAGIAASTSTTVVRLAGSNPREFIASVYREHTALVQRTEGALDDIARRADQLRPDVAENVRNNAEPFSAPSSGPPPGSDDGRLTSSRRAPR